MTAPNLSAADALATAQAIGDRLAHDAIWHADQCNWLGMQEKASNSTRAAYGALGPDLYAGTSGVALFLAELYSRTGEQLLARTAAASLRQALSWTDAIQPAVRLGLYAGWPGIAYAAVRLGAILDQPLWIHQATRLVRRMQRDTPALHDHDLIGGSAGAIAALIWLYDQLGEDWLLELAARLGEDLVAAARRTAGGGASWSARSVRWPRPLTGLSHGAAGVGLALLELYHVTGGDVYRQMAERAFAYERRWFDADQANWSDLREVDGGRAQRANSLPAASFWCHGAPGIGLARAAAYCLLATPIYRAEALTALSTTCRVADELLEHGGTDFSLCHGLAGLAEVLSLLGPALGSEGHQACRLVQRVAATGEHSWPRGTPGGEAPGLMVGLAGIGYFYLRRHDPRLQSMLLPGMGPGERLSPPQGSG